MLNVEQAGELKFKVYDNRYDDNAGAYDVDVVVIPAGVIPPPVRVGGMP